MQKFMKSPRTPRRGLPAAVPFVDTRQAAALLGCSVRHLHHLIAQGVIAPLGSAGDSFVFGERAIARARRRHLSHARLHRCSNRVQKETER